MIVHILSVRKKVVLYRALRLGTHIDAMVVYATAQRDFITRDLRYPSEQITLMPFMVDTEFFAIAELAEPTAPTPVICAAGLEFRDYPTLIEAVRDLDVECVIAAGSRWSKRPDSSQGVSLPHNVTVCSLGYKDLRTLYARSSLVVVPLSESDFQAGITTILEAMSMRRAVICTRTRGQTDTIVDGVNGRYVPPADVASLRAAIIELLADPPEASRLAEAGRNTVVATATVEAYAQRLAGLLAKTHHRRERGTAPR